MVPGVKEQSYRERLGTIYLSTVEERRLNGALITTFKLLNTTENVNSEQFYERCRERATRNSLQKMSRCTSILPEL